jgi:hypothetical protein
LHQAELGSGVPAYHCAPWEPGNDLTRSRPSAHPARTSLRPVWNAKRRASAVPRSLPDSATSCPCRNGTAGQLTIDRADRPHYPVKIMTLAHHAQSIPCCYDAEAKPPAARQSSYTYFTCAYPAVPTVPCHILLKPHLLAHTSAGLWAALPRRSMTVLTIAFDLWFSLQVATCHRPRRRHA